MNDIETKLPPPTIGHQPYLVEESYANDTEYDGVIAVKKEGRNSFSVSFIHLSLKSVSD